MKHLKLFENFNKELNFEINEYTGLFDIYNENNVVELVQEDLTAIKEILDLKYSFYQHSNVTIKFESDTLTISQDDEYNISFDKNEQQLLLKEIDLLFEYTAEYSEISDEEYKIKSNEQIHTNNFYNQHS